MANLILVTGSAGRVGAVGRTITELLLKQGKAVRAMVRNEDERAQALRDIGAEVVVGDLLDLDSMHRVIADCETMYFRASGFLCAASSLPSRRLRELEVHCAHPEISVGAQDL